MNKLPYVLSDLDGTICDSSLSIHPATIEDILTYQKASQGKFSFITGRLMGATKFLASQLNVELPIVSCNGALISDWKTEKVLYVKYLNPDLIVEIIKDASNFGIESIVYTPKELVGLENNKRIQMWKRYSHQLPPNLRCGIVEYKDTETLIKALLTQQIKPVQLVLYSSNPKLQEASHKIVERYQDKVEATPSFAHVFNITARGANKRSGLEALSKILNINPQDIVVFGDSYNDISMLEEVKRGFVVANGVAEAKEVAYSVVPAMKDNGVGKTLRKLIGATNHD